MPTRRREWVGRGAKRLGELPPGPVGPPPVAGFDTWYDPSDVSTVTHVAGGVSAVADKGSGGNNLSVSGAPGVGVPPNLFGGRSAIYLSGSLGTSLTSARSMSDVTSSAFIVACLHSFGLAKMLLAPNNDGGIELNVNSSGLLVANKADMVEIAAMASPAVTVGVPFVAGYCLDTTTCRLWNNLTGETDSHAQSLTAGRTLVVGREPLNGTTTGEVRGYIGEIVMYPTTLSNGDAEAVIGYLMSKWGIS